jgi:GH25 family lysozyme M1 (1,4-beta-N-acetylmuramidase)
MTGVARRIPLVTSTGPGSGPVPAPRRARPDSACENRPVSGDQGDKRPARGLRVRASLAAAAALVAAAGSAVLAGGPVAAATPGPAKTAAVARGVDLSAFQHPGGASIDWRSVARAGYRFAFIKSTEGTYYVNPYFKSDVAKAEAAGLLVGAYHFANPTRTSGTAQANYALRHGAYRADGRMLPMILDIEPDPYLDNFCYGLSKHEMVSWIAAFMARAHRVTGQWPVINTQPVWWGTCAGGTTDFARDQLWVQDPGRSKPRLAKGWTRWAWWQYSTTASVPGISGGTDVNKMASWLLAVADPGNQAGPPGARVRVLVRSVNAAAGQALRYVATGLPSGLSLSRTTGVITGRLPRTPGRSKVAITISAAGVAPVTWRLTWTVR